MKYIAAVFGLVLATPVLAAIPYANPPAGTAVNGQAGALLSRLPPLPQTYDQAAPSGCWMTGS